MIRLGAELKPLTYFVDGKFRAALSGLQISFLLYLKRIAVRGMDSRCILFPVRFR